MTRTHLQCLFGLALVAALNINVARAQTASQSFEQVELRQDLGTRINTQVDIASELFRDLERKLKPGQTAIVTQTGGKRIVGKVITLSPSSLELAVGAGSTRTFEAPDVQLIKRSGPIWDGAVKGALVAIIPAAIVGAGDCYDCHADNAIRVFGAFSLLSAPIGLLIDALVGPKTVYRVPDVRRRVTFAPILLRDRQALLAAIDF